MNDYHYVTTNSVVFIQVGEHNDCRGPFLPYHLPEITEGGCKWSLCCYVLTRSGVALVTSLHLQSIDNSMSYAYINVGSIDIV